MRVWLLVNQVHLCTPFVFFRCWMHVYPKQIDAMLQKNHCMIMLILASHPFCFSGWTKIQKAWGLSASQDGKGNETEHGVSMANLSILFSGYCRYFFMLKKQGTFTGFFMFKMSIILSIFWNVMQSSKCPWSLKIYKWILSGEHFFNCCFHC